MCVLKVQGRHICIDQQYDSAKKSYCFKTLLVWKKVDLLKFVVLQSSQSASYLVAGKYEEKQHVNCRTC